MENRNLKNKKVCLPAVLIIAFAAFCLLTIRIGNKIYPVWAKKVDFFVSDYVVSSVDSEKLRKLKNVEYIDISAGDIDNVDFLENMPELEELHLMRDPIDRERKYNNEILDFHGLSNCKKLKYIGAIACGIENIKDLTNAGTVNKIYIIEGRQIINFSGCNSDHLEELLIDCIGIRDFHGIENLKKLKWFDYNGDFSPTYVTPEPDIFVDISPMAALSELETLTIRDFPYSIDVSCINNPKLKTISFTGCYTNEISADWINSFPLLEEITITDSKITDVKKVCESKSLKTIHIAKELYTDDEISYLTEHGLLDGEKSDESEVLNTQ